ncbi:MAG TPA: hypothetical protein VFI28_03545, partial [Candidatus Limnocylindrales bacterium]|nr:hypothetical protein [Candidatus Limnocylindrales bacterium]
SLVARELERRSAPLAWSLTASRVGWLAWRAAPPAVLVALLLTGPALAGERLEAASYPQFDPAQSFTDVGARGALLVVRGLVAFGLGLAAGAVFGRTLPAVIVAGGLCLLGLAAADVARPAWLPREAVAREELDGATAANPLAFGEGFRLPDGRLLTFDESASLRPPDARVIDSPDYALWLFHSGWQRVFIGISGTHFGDVELRETAASGLVALAGLVAAFVAVRRRRPAPGLALEREARGDAVLSGATGPPRPPPAWRRSGPWLSWLMTSRVGRPEVVGAVVAALGVAAVTLIATKLLADARVAEGCVDREFCATGTTPFNALYAWAADNLYPVLATVPFVVGGLLGAPVLAREFETGTGRMAWALTASRATWLLWRILPPLLLAILVLGPVAILGDALRHEQTLRDPTHDFDWGYLRGPRLVARGLIVFAFAVLAGALLRRVLPALVTAAIAAVILYNTLDWAAMYWLPLQVIGDRNDLGNPAAITPGSYFWSVALEAPDGSMHLSQDVALANGFPRRAPGGGVIDLDPEFIAWYTARGYREVNAGIDASQYPQLVIRETAVLFAGAGVLLVVSGAVLQRSRPG